MRAGKKEEEERTGEQKKQKNDKLGQRKKETLVAFTLPPAAVSVHYIRHKFTTTAYQQHKSLNQTLLSFSSLCVFLFLYSKTCICNLILIVVLS